MLVWQGVGDVVDVGTLVQDVGGHVVHGGLDGGGVFEGKPVEGDLEHLGHCLVKEALVGKLVDVLDGADLLAVEVPGAVDVGGQDSVGGWGQGGVVALVVAHEAGAGGLQDGEVLEGGRELEVAAAVVREAGGLHVLAVLLERVVVQLAVHLVLRPLVLDDVHVDARHVGVLADKVLREMGGEPLDGPHVCLSGLHQHRVLHCVCRHDRRVVGLGVRHVEVASEKHSHRRLKHLLLLRVVLVLLDLEKLDVVLAVAGVL